MWTWGTPAVTSTQSKKIRSRRPIEKVWQRLEEDTVEHKGIGITNHDEVDDYNNTADDDDLEFEQYRDDMDSGHDMEEHHEDHRLVYGADHEDYDEEHCDQNDGCAVEWTEEGGYADDKAEHAGESGYAECNAEEDECHDGEDDYSVNDDDRWDSDGGHFSESDDGTWAVST